MLQRFIRIAGSLAVFAMLVAAGPVRATDYSDLWYIPAEGGWGANVVQSDDFMFVTFFIYGPDNKPTWYSADLSWDGAKFTGGLFTTTGTYWLPPWNAADVTTQQVGTATFTPDALNAYQATLSWTVNGVGTAIKAVERQTLTRIAIGGSYVGGQAGTYSGCNASGTNGAYTDKYSLAVTQTTGGNATFTFTYDNANSTCTLSGPLEQHGKLYRIPGATYQCSGDLNFSTTGTVYELKATGQGIEGRFAATLPNSGCQENANFSAVLE